MTEHLFHGAEEGIRTPDPLITNQLLWPTELHRRILLRSTACKDINKNLISPNYTEFYVLSKTADSVIIPSNRKVQRIGCKDKIVFLKNAMIVVFF